jgi:acetylornithine deacetylase
MTTEQILSRLIAFDTTSRNANMDLIKYIQDMLVGIGAEVTIIPDEAGKKANLYATIGPRNVGGILLSGHTDVVPIDGQSWTKPAFELTQSNDRLYGRGTTDMKGFVACALSAAITASKVELKTPLHLAFSYDEEIGCVGVRSLIEMLSSAPFRPKMCIVGEPTNMGIATGHKGKTGMIATCIGREAHSALAPTGLNAIHLATEFISALRDIQSDLAANGAQDSDYDIPYSTIHVGKIHGGVALNIVPNSCELHFEIRNIAKDDPKIILTKIKDAALKITKRVQDRVPEAAINIEVFNSYPGLDTPSDANIVTFVKSLTGANGTLKVAFGTEGGLFDQVLGIPTVVCGPGSMEQGHKPDEYIERAQLAQCDVALARLVDHLKAGIH